MTTPAGAGAGTRPAQASGGSGQAAPPPSYPFPVGMYDNEAQDGGTMTLLQAGAAAVPDLQHHADRVDPRLLV